MNILVIDDDEVDIELIKEHIRFYRAKHPDFDADVTGITGSRGDLASVLNKPWDAIIVDYVIPGGISWPEIYPVIREKTDAPIIVISGLINGTRGLSAITIGAADYLPKDEMDHLGHAIHRALLYHTAVKANQEAAQSLIRKVEKSAR